MMPHDYEETSPMLTVPQASIGSRIDFHKDAVVSGAPAKDQVVLHGRGLRAEDGPHRELPNGFQRHRGRYEEAWPAWRRTQHVLRVRHICANSGPRGAWRPFHVSSGDFSKSRSLLL